MRAPAANATLELVELGGACHEVSVDAAGERVGELNLSTAKALQHLDPDRAMPMRELAAGLHANPSNVSVVVARLEARDLLERESADDRRVKGVRLTPRGVRLRSQLEARLLAEHPATRGLSDAEQSQLLALLRRLD